MGAQSIIDKNVQRNIIHKNTAARKKSLLTMKVKALEGGAAAAAPVAAEETRCCIRDSAVCLSASRPAPTAEGRASCWVRIVRAFVYNLDELIRPQYQLSLG